MKRIIIFVLIALFTLGFLFKKDIVEIFRSTRYQIITPEENKATTFPEEAYRYTRYQIITPEENKATTFPEEAYKHLGDKVFIRIFKEESELELWSQEVNSQEFRLLHTFDICKWSGKLGPKKQEGDGQSPEGFYDVSIDRLNPYSSYHLSFNIGFPNKYDQLLGYTGSYLMIHGDCVSIGCYAMGNSNIEIIYDFVEESLQANEESVSVHIFPFRMEEENLKKYQKHEAYEFWQNLKIGYDLFEEDNIPPQISICDNKHCFTK